jgi:putative copper resistance protein D
LAKIAAFLAMLAIAAINRYRLTPGLANAIALGDFRAAISALRRSLAFEAGAALVILGIVAWLGTLEPPIAAG